MKAKLQRMKTHLQLNNQKDVQINKQSESTDKSSLVTKWEKYGFKPFVIDDEISFQKKKIYPLAKDLALLKDELEHIHQYWQQFHKEHPLSCRHVPLERMMFFDTETTGLSTGAGNSIFLIGYARVLQDGIEVTQHVLASPADEVAFLYGFLLDFHEEDYLITYNGKAFDWPHVKSRHTFVRNDVPELPRIGHIDLLYAARRLWKHELPSCRLTIVEQEKLHIHRKDDTPGSLAPILYFDYLQTEDPEHLAGIVKHNEQDVLSLLQLYVEICKRLFFEKEPLPAKEHIQIGHWFEQLKWGDYAEKHYKRAIETFDSSRHEAFYKLGLLYKKRKKFEEAKRAFLHGIGATSMPYPLIFIELAKIYEHVDKDYVKAYKYTEKANHLLKKSARLTGNDKKILNDVEKRLQRLKGKLE